MKLNDFSKLRLDPATQAIDYFLYRQDGTRQPMRCRDTPSNRLVISWIQIHDAPPPRSPS